MSAIHNNQCNYANTEFILLSIINNERGIICDIHENIIKYIEYSKIMKTTMAPYTNMWSVPDIRYFNIPDTQQFFFYIIRRLIT